LYTTCSTISEDDIRQMTGSSQDGNLLTTLLNIGQSNNIEPIRRLNAMGADILIRNGWVPPMGDWEWGDAGDVSGPSRFIDITADSQDTYFAIDRNRGRIFTYDFQGNLLFVFGGLGNKAGYFQYPTAIEYKDGAILVLDARSGGMTVFTPTEYGQLIHAALAEYIKGNYEYSAELWERSLMYNANQDLAYIGLGRALMRQDRYKEAMYYFDLKYDRVNYSKAFQQYRKQVIEENIGFIIGGIIGLIVLWNVYKTVRKIRKSSRYAGTTP
jgi:tetratricopeptide (TPR) repeat protein